MQSPKLILTIITLFHVGISAMAYCFPERDTLIHSEKFTDSVLHTLTKENIKPSPEKVTLISAYTRDGFRDLFSRFEYLPDIPYAQQINPQAEAFMEDYIIKHQKYLLQLQQKGGLYFNLIESVLREYGLPMELKYLAVIESGLKSNVVSHAGAGGPWQLMPFTGREYGLIVNRHQDERFDYTKSSHAAARLLLDLYSEFQDWLLVLAAYNGGKGRLVSAMKKSGKKDFWSIQQYLPEESRNHVKKFIATHYVMESGDPYRLMSILVPKQNPAHLTDMENKLISGRYRADILSDIIHMSKAEFNQLNPTFATQLITHGETMLILPSDKMRLFEQKKDDILQKSVESLLRE